MLSIGWLFTPKDVLARDYPQALRGLGVPILVVAVTYDAKTTKYSCHIAEAPAE